MTLALGIDIGGTKIAGALVNENGQVISTQRVPTDAHLGGKHVLESALNLASQLIGQSTEAIVGIGIGAGGVIDSDNGVVVSASEILPGWTGIDISGGFRKRFGLPICVENDVNALAHGEVMFGNAKGLGCVVFLALGTGVGGAIVIDGKIHHGAHWSAGEIGFLLINQKETLESYCSGSGLLRTYLSLDSESTTITAAEIGSRALADSGSMAASAVRLTGETLGYGLVSIANVLDPDKIVIGGGLASLGDLLLDPARKVLRERALPGPSQCPVVTASLGEHASVIGAASLALRSAITE